MENGVETTNQLLTGMSYPHIHNFDIESASSSTGRPNGQEPQEPMDWSYLP